MLDSGTTPLASGATSTIAWDFAPVSLPLLSHTEALRVLRASFARKAGAIPAERLARYIVELYRGSPWPILEAAGDALLRRFAAAERDGLRICSRPAGAPFGRYEVRPARGAPRPYRTALSGVEPFDGSCDCADYARASLGLCKHLLVALDDLFAHPRRLAQAEATAHAPTAGLRWDPIRPLHGPGDWLDRVTLEVGPRPPKITRWFRVRPGPRSLKSSFASDPKRRLSLVDELAVWLRQHEEIAAREPALGRLLADEAAHLARELELRGLRARAKRAPMDVLYPYQREGVERFLARGRLLLADDMGLGKTVQAIAAAHALFAAKRVRRGLLIVPNSLKPQWQSEWTRFSSAPIRVIEGGSEARARAYAECPEGFLIANYEQVLRDADLMRAWAPELVVLDEAQRIKNWETRTARSIKSLRPDFRLALTGTPLENRLGELVSVIEWIDDAVLEPRWRLAPHHSEPDPEGGRSVGVNHLGVLRERLAPWLLRRRRAEILHELPPRVDQRVPVELTPSQAVLHDELDKPIAQLTRIAKRRPLTRQQFLRLMGLFTQQRVIANGLAQHHFELVWPKLRDAAPTPSRLEGLDSPKLGVLRELLQRIVVEGGRSVVVFSQWRRALELAHWACSDILGDAGLRAAFFTGAQGLRARTRSVVDLHDDPDTRVLFCSDAGSVGLNLQRAADCVIHLDLPWNPAVLEQRTARLHRLGQTRSVDVITLVTEGSIEARMEQALRSKKALFDGLFDGDADTVLFDRDAVPILALAAPTATDELATAPVAHAEGPVADEQVPVADEQRTVLEAAASAPSAPEPVGAVGIDALFERVQIIRRPDGGMTVQADRGAAAALEAVFAGLASLMRVAGMGPAPAA